MQEYTIFSYFFLAMIHIVDYSNNHIRLLNDQYLDDNHSYLFFQEILTHATLNIKPFHSIIKCK
jgi:hypothetical protein